MRYQLLLTIVPLGVYAMDELQFSEDAAPVGEFRRPVAEDPLLRVGELTPEERQEAAAQIAAMMRQQAPAQLQVERPMIPDATLVFNKEPVLPG